MKIIANMATYPPRRASMIAAARTIAPQVTTLNIVLNEYSEKTEELKSVSNITQHLPPYDTKDTGKFLPDIDDADYVLLVDDDIDFPDDLVECMLAEQRDKGINSVIGYHGTIYRRPRFSRKPRKLLRWLRFRAERDILQYRKVLAFSQELEETTHVDQLGTGVVLLPARYYPAFDFMRDSAFFVDVRFAKWCFNKRLIQYAAKRPADWLKSIDHDDTIYQNFTLQSPLCVRREIMSYAFKQPGRNQGA